MTRDAAGDIFKKNTAVCSTVHNCRNNHSLKGTAVRKANVHVFSVQGASNCLRQYVVQFCPMLYCTTALYA